MRPAHLVIASLVLALAVTLPAAACEIVSIGPNKLYSNQYVFLGRVVGPVGPLSPEQVEKMIGWQVPGEVWGLRIAVEQPVWLPQAPQRDFEVFPFGTGDSCEYVGFTREELAAWSAARVGSQVQVVAQAVLPSSNPVVPGDLQLFTAEEVGGSIASNEDQDGHPLTTADSVFDYRQDREKAIRAPRTQPPYGHGFEIYKDLARLEKAGTQEAKAKIIERLAYSYLYASSFETLVRSQLREPQEIDRLLATRKSWITHIDQLRAEALAQRPDSVVCRDVVPTP